MYIRVERERNYKELEEMVGKAGGENIIWCGDDEGNTEVRISKDIRKNKEGEELVETVRELGLCIIIGNGGGGGLKQMRRRFGKLIRRCRYWMKEEEREYRLCEEGEETLELTFEKCSVTGRSG